MRDRYLQGVLDAVREQGTATVEDVVAIIDIPRRTAMTYLAQLAKKGKLRRVGTRRYPNETLNPGPRTRQFRTGRPCTEFKAV
jgi:predicted transcriptional regulator of viral defense system